jgi:hypothetical protein
MILFGIKWFRLRYLFCLGGCLPIGFRRIPINGCAPIDVVSMELWCIYFLSVISPNKCGALFCVDLVCKVRYQLIHILMLNNFAGYIFVICNLKIVFRLFGWLQFGLYRRHATIVSLVQRFVVLVVDQIKIQV